MATTEANLHPRTWRLYAPGPFGQVHIHAAQGGAAGRRPLICFHGTPYSGVEFTMLQRELARDRLVLCPDTPGFGGSDRPGSPPELTAYAAGLFEGIRRSGLIDDVDRVDLLGHHTGAAIASELAVAQANSVGRLVLSGVPLFTAAQRAEMMARYLKPSPLFSDPQFVAAEFSAAVLRDTPVPELRRLALFEERLRTGTDAWWGGRAVFAHDLEATLRQVAKPTLFLMLRDPLAANSRAAQRLVAGSERAELEASTTDDALEMDASQLAAAICPFLDR